MNQQRIQIPNTFATRWVAITFMRQSSELPDQASWPFTKLTVQPNLIIVRLFGQKLLLAPDDIQSIEEYYQNYAVGQPVNEHGFRIVLKSPIITNDKLPAVASVNVAPRGSPKSFDRVAEALQTCGFIVAKSL